MNANDNFQSAIHPASATMAQPPLPSKVAFSLAKTRPGVIVIRPTARIALALLLLMLCAAPSSAQGPLTNGWTHTGNISSAGEADVWTFTATAGDSIVVRVGEVFSTGFAPKLQLLSPSSTVLAVSTTTVSAEIAVKATNSGTFSVVVSDNSGLLTNAYRLTLAKTGSPVLVSPGDEGGPLTNGVMHTGVIDVGDLDVWTVTATAGQSIVVRIGETNNVAFSPQLRLYDPSGALLDTSSTTVGAEVAVTATNSGTFLLVVGDFSGSWSGAGPYRLTLAKTGEPVVVSPGDEGGPMTGVGVYTGTIGTGDLDVWTFTACQGDAIILRMDEVTSGSTLTPQLRLYGRDGTLLNTASGAASAQISRTAPAGGNYTVVAGDVSGSWSGSGGYTLTVNGLSSGLRLCAPTFSGTNVNLAGIGGMTNASFVLFTQTNVATLAAAWTPLLTNQFDQFGVFSRSNVSVKTEAQRYFRLLEQ